MKVSSVIQFWSGVLVIAVGAIGMQFVPIHHWDIALGCLFLGILLLGFGMMLVRKVIKIARGGRSIL